MLGRIVRPSLFHPIRNYHQRCRSCHLQFSRFEPLVLIIDHHRSRLIKKPSGSGLDSCSYRARTAFREHRISRTNFSQEHNSAIIVRGHSQARCRRRSRCQCGRRCGKARIVALNVRSSGLCIRSRSSYLHAPLHLPYILSITSASVPSQLHVIIF